MKQTVKNYLSEIGRKGGFAGKGSAARKAAALKANRARWKDHRKGCQAAKHSSYQNVRKRENKV